MRRPWAGKSWNPRPLLLAALLGALAWAVADGTCDQLATNAIVGGTSVPEGEAQWQVALVPASAPGAYQAVFCGGSLIHREWVLTAAHCLTGPDLEPADVEVYAGSVSLEEGGQRAGVREIIVHPAFRVLGGADAALLRLAEPLDLEPVPLLMQPSSPLLAMDSAGVAFGWGSMAAYPPGGDPRPDFPVVLQQVTLPILADALCSQVYGDAYEAGSSICAGDFEAGGIDTCQGDSGGPFVVRKDAASRYLLAGIIGCGCGCAFPGYPGVYTDVTSILGFILEHVDLAPPGLEPRTRIPALTRH